MLIDALRRRLHQDEGFTLIEVITAIFVISILSTSALWFYLNGLNISHSQERRQLAITVVNEAMETVRGATLAKDVTSGLAAVYSGRDAGRVNAAFTAAAGVQGVSQTYPQWDTSATAASTMTFPLTATVTRSGTEFAVTTLVGVCYQPAVGGDCIRIAGLPAPAATPPAGYTPLTRTIVTATWTAGDQCASGCRYSVSSLLDDNLDLSWNTGP